MQYTYDNHLRLYAFLKKYREQNGKIPKWGEMIFAMGVSRQSIATYLQRLEKDGYIKRETVRTFTLLK